MNRVPSGSSFDALVVGRGAVGSAAALGFAQAGLRCALVAPAASPPAAQPDEWDARVFALSPASRQLLQRLRAWDAFDTARVAPVYDMRVYPDARVGAPELHFGAYEACVEALNWIVEGSNLQSALDRALSFSGVAGVDGRVESIETSDPAAAVVTLGDGRALRARLVVAADGANSPLREMLGIDASVREYPQHAIVANFATSRPHRDCAYQWFGAHGILALLPLPGQRCSIVWSAPPPLADSLRSASARDLADRVEQVSLGVLGRLECITPAQSFPLRLIRVARATAPRVALVGDAAHAVHPLSGQGMNLGFGDVDALLCAVGARESFRDVGDPLLLRRYERARAEAVATMRLTTDGLQRLFDPDLEPALPVLVRPLVGLRELGWRLVDSSHWLKRRLIAHAAW
jgi:2-polyprenylphenol 6-hydroxylase